MSTSARAEQVRLAAHAIVALVVAWLVFSRTDVLSVDVAGHLSSAQAFARGYFHRFYDGHFLGWIHDLFYPPLEDVLVAGWLALSRVFGVGTLTAYRAYLGAVGAGYVMSLWALGGVLPTQRARAVFAVFALASFFVLDDDLYLQGLKLVDLSKIGLSSQLLGGAFTWLLIRELLGRGRRVVLVLTLAAAVLSHLVMGIVAALVIGVYTALTRDKQKLVACGVAMGLTAVFWVPFLAHGAFMVKNTVLSSRLPIAELAAAVVLAVCVRSARARALAWSAAILLAPTSIVPLAIKLSIKLPEFHWYRLDFIGLFLLVLAGCFAWDDPEPLAPRWRTYGVRAALAGALVATIVQMVPRGAYVPSAAPFAIDPAMPTHEPQGTAPYGRHWILQDGRPFDFSAESLATAIDPDARTPKGLFWESSKTNHVVGSYMATFNHPPVVLDYFYFHDYTCEFQACLLDHFVADFNVTRWSADENVLRATMPDIDHRACNGSIWGAGGTPSFALAEQPGFGLDGHRYRTAVVAPRGPLTNAAVEIVQPSEVEPFVYGGQFYFHRYFKAVAEQCERKEERRHVLLVQPDWDAYQEATRGLAAPAEGIAASLRKTGTGRFDVDVPSTTDVVFHVKLNYLPGARLFREDGSEARVFRAYPGMVAVGHGSFTLVYETTPPMMAGNVLSLATLLGWIAAEVVLRRRAGAKNREQANDLGKPSDDSR